MRLIKLFILLLALTWTIPGISLEPSNQVGGPLLNMHERRINISVTGVSIKNVIRAFSKQTGINVVIAEGIEGTVSVILKDSNPIEALTSILGTKGYSWYAQDEKTIVATPNPTSHSFKLQYAKATKAQESLSQIAGSEGAISAHEASNTLVVNGTSALILKIERALKKIDAKPRQVAVETKIIQLNVGNVSNLGMIAKYTHAKGEFKTQAFNNPSNPGLITSFINNSLNLEAALSALETREDFNLVSSPRVLAVENTEAEIHVGERLPYRLTTVSETSTTETVEFMDIGTRLIFTPRISDDGIITLDIHPEVSEGNINADNLPQTSTSEATTIVSVRDGQTIVIGGLIEENNKETTSGIPFLKDIPIIGLAFRNRGENIEKNELLVFMTPHIVNEELIKQMVDEINEKEDAAYNSKRDRKDIFL